MTRASLISAVFMLAIAAANSAHAVEPDLAGFKAKVAPLFAKYCTDCHGRDEPEAKLSLETINANLFAGDDYENWKLVDEQLRIGEMPPEDEPQPTAAERETILAWTRQEFLKTQRPDVVTDKKLLLPQFGNYVDHSFLFGKRLPRVYPAPPRVWRLRPEIYDAKMPRLAERVSGLANGLNKFDGSDFKDYAAPYFLDEAAATPLIGNAKKVAAKMVAPTSKDRAFKQLASGGKPDKEAVDEAIETAFRKVLARRPTADEKQRYKAFYEKAAATGGYENAATAMLAAILLQPEVLFRQELGDGKLDTHGRTRLASREIAYALSYALDDRPLDEFMQAAAAGKLATSDQVAKAVSARLQDDSKLYGKNPRILQFFREYFNYPFANEVFKDRPAGGEHNAGRLVADLETTIRDILREDKNVLAELLTTRRFYVGAAYRPNKDKRKGVVLQSTSNNGKRSAYHTAYSLPPDWKWSLHLQPVSFREDERAGVLTHPAWLAAWSGNFDNHPVQRGKWIRTHLLGGTVPDVPIGVDARVPEKEHTSFRERLRIATKAAYCWRCHRKMDPLGVAFERYDHYGRYQRLDAGQPVDASSEVTLTGVPELDGRKFDNPTKMMDFLAKSEYVEQVFVRHVFRYFLGRNETLGDANTLQDAHKAYRESGGSFNALVTSILSSDSFLYRQATTTKQNRQARSES